jgi:hypothetical protein
VQHIVDKEQIYNRVGSSSLLLEEKGGGMRCFPSFVKINPCRGVVDDYKVRKNHLTLPSPQGEGAVAVRLLL